MKRKIYGSIEIVSMPDFGISIEAKVDTGAWTGALHCTNINEKDNELSFNLLGDASRVVSTHQYELRQVRSANGQMQNRFLIPVTLAIQGVTYHTTLGLSDRSDMSREMLLGRKFLIENKILVDVCLSLENDHEVEMGLL